MQMILEVEGEQIATGEAAAQNVAAVEGQNTTPSGTGTATPPNNGWISIVLMVAMIAVMYFVMIRPQRKRQKEEQKMRNSLRVGDEITTIGGICGRVLQVKDDSLVIETGADRSKMTIKKWAIQSCDTVRDPQDIDDDDDDDDDI